MFQTVPLSIIRSFSLYTQQWYMSYRFADSLRASCQPRKLSANLYDIYHCCVYSEKLLMMDRGTAQNIYSFIPKNKFEKSEYLVGFIIRIYHDVLSPEHQNIFLNIEKHNGDVPLENEKKKKSVPKFIRNYVYLLQPQSPVSTLTRLSYVT